MCAYKYIGASYSLPFPRYCCIYLQNMNGYYELSPPSCVLPPPFPAKGGGGQAEEQRKDSTVGFPFSSFYQPAEVRMLLAPLRVRARAVHLATESRGGRQQNYPATRACARARRRASKVCGMRSAAAAEGPSGKRCVPPGMAAMARGAPRPTGSRKQLQPRMLCF